MRVACASCCSSFVGNRDRLPPKFANWVPLRANAAVSAPYTQALSVQALDNLGKGAPGCWGEKPAEDGVPEVGSKSRLEGLRIDRRGEVDVPVLSGIDLDIAQGTFEALMGPSGSGKSTLLNLIS